MKFKDYVGDDVKTELDIKYDLVDTSLGETDKKFLDVVAREYLTETSIGFGLNKMDLKRVFDYVKSWLIRYKIRYEAINPYITVATVEGEYKRDGLIKALKEVREQHIFKPEGVFILREGKKDFIIVDYQYNKEFTNKLNECISHFKLAIKNNSCYIRLFSMKSESFPLRMFDDMVFSLPDVPNVKAGSVGLLVRRK